MRIGVLSQSSTLHATRRILEAIEARGHAGVWVPILESWVVVGGSWGASRVLPRGEAAPELDGLIPRIGTFMPQLALTQLRALTQAGLPALNGVDAFERTREKPRAIAHLADAGLPTVPTIYVKDLDGVAPAVERLGGGPVVVKPTAGNQGRGVLRADSAESAVSTVQALLQLNREVVLQPYLENGGRDRRLIVVGDQVVAAIERTARAGDFRSNLHQGGTARSFHPNAEQVRLAVEAVRALRLDVAGVDLLPNEAAPGGRPGVPEGSDLILEVNASPGLEGVEAATAVDVAGAFVDRLVARIDLSRKGVGNADGGAV